MMMKEKVRLGGLTPDTKAGAEFLAKRDPETLSPPPLNVGGDTITFPTGEELSPPPFLAATVGLLDDIAAEAKAAKESDPYARWKAGEWEERLEQSLNEIIFLAERIGQAKLRNDEASRVELQAKLDAVVKGLLSE